MIITGRSRVVAHAAESGIFPIPSSPAMPLSLPPPPSFDGLMASGGCLI